MRALVLPTLLIEKLSKFSYTSVGFSKQGHGGALRTEFTVLNKTQGSRQLEAIISERCKETLDKLGLKDDFQDQS